ncbi:MAG: hypothetical protein FWH40_07130 [Coriobacteriia bacterium]|nr:hypothetical protein [Coriobacteriia bacterium]
MDRTPQRIKEAENEVVISQDFAAISLNAEGFINVRVPVDQFVESMRSRIDEIIEQNAGARLEELKRTLKDTIALCKIRWIHFCTQRWVERCQDVRIDRCSRYGYLIDFGSMFDNPLYLKELVAKKILSEEFFTQIELEIIKSIQG